MKEKITLFDLSKSFTIQSSTVCFTAMLGLISNPEIVTDIFIMIFSIDINKAELYTKILTVIVASLGMGGVVKGRADAENKPKLKDRL